MLRAEATGQGQIEKSELKLKPEGLQITWCANFLTCEVRRQSIIFNLFTNGWNSTLPYLIAFFLFLFQYIWVSTSTRFKTLSSSSFGKVVAWSLLKQLDQKQQMSRSWMPFLYQKKKGKPERKGKTRFLALIYYYAWLPCLLFVATSSHSIINTDASSLHAGTLKKKKHTMWMSAFEMTSVYNYNMDVSREWYVYFYLCINLWT
jgi:hypothetical protein